jgi:hypothetical protein
MSSAAAADPSFAVPHLLEDIVTAGLVRMCCFILFLWVPTLPSAAKTLLNTPIKSYLLRLISFYFPGTFKFGTRQRLVGGRHFCGKTFFAADERPPIQLEICFVHPKDQRLCVFLVRCYSSRQSPRPSQIGSFATHPRLFFRRHFLAHTFFAFRRMITHETWALYWKHKRQAFGCVGCFIGLPQ